MARSEVIHISDEYTEEIHASRRRRPSLSSWLHLTNSCNLACTYCYIHKSRGDMSPETGKVTVDAMVATCRRNGISSINLKFAGGEPLLRFSLVRELVDYSRRTCLPHGIKVSFTVLTNATMVSSDMAEYLASNNIGVSVSLDGVEAINDESRKYRNGRGSFRGVISGLQILRDNGVEPFIMTTVSAGSYHGLPELTKFLVEGEYGFRFSLERDCETGHPRLLDHLGSVTASLHQCYDYIEQNLPRKDFLKLHRVGDVNLSRPLRRACGAGSSFFSVGHDGRMGLCGLGLAHPFSSINEDGDLLNRIRHSNGTLARLVASDYPSCSDCVWRKSCAGGCPLQTLATYGRYDTRSPYCEVYREILPRILRARGLQMIRSVREAGLA
jgi:uncharacterized protein